MRYLAILLVVLCFSVINAQQWSHPGVLVSAKQLAYIKEQVDGKHDPMYSAYISALKTPILSKTYKPKGPPADGNINCGPYNNPDIGCSDDMSDGAAAYAQAVLWAITGDKTWAENSITILNAYAVGLKKYTNSNAGLVSAWSAIKLSRAAEIIYHTGAGWPESDFKRFCEMATHVYIPLIYKGSGSNGNWELSMVDAMISISVLTENKTLFDHSTAMWRERVPAYLYYTPADGNKHVPLPRNSGSTSWFSQTVFNATTSGVCQETCRDLGHVQLGLEGMINAAETAFIQGLDLYKEQGPRITTGVELTAYFLMGNHYQAYFCNGNKIGILDTPTFEIFYNHYHNQLNYTLKYTYEYLTTKVRKMPEAYQEAQAVLETLTHGSS